jgi:lipopolysaccharide/colanic/teichoic acid biosynthesis glycosyltransferase
MPAFADAALRRLLDVTVASTLLIVLSPVLALLALLVRATSPGPAFFRQTRIGRDGRPFVLLKLRTMRADAAHTGPAITAGADPRITPLGARLRRTKLDELPQLWNVLCGDMSLVGPRPELPLYVARYTAAQRAVLRTRPGITDPASLAWADEAAPSRPSPIPSAPIRRRCCRGSSRRVSRTSSDAPCGATSPS